MKTGLGVDHVVVEHQVDVAAGLGSPVQAAVQAQVVADRYYWGLENLVLLSIDTDRLSSPLRFDPVGSETFPHIYGPINSDAVVQVTPLQTDSDGRIKVPPISASASSL